MIGEKGGWDDHGVGASTVIKTENGFEMYYSGCTIKDNSVKIAIGYATSEDGDHWKKYPKNPIYSTDHDPFIMNIGHDNTVVEAPSYIIKGNTGFMYYDYCTATGKIGIATARVH